MPNYPQLRTNVVALVKRLATHTVTILETVNAAPVDASKPWRVGAGTFNEFECSAVVTDITQSEGPAHKRCIVPGDVGITPDESMRVQIGSDQYRILNVTAYEFGGGFAGWSMELDTWQTSSTQPT